MHFHADVLSAHIDGYRVDVVRLAVTVKIRCRVRLQY